MNKKIFQLNLLSIIFFCIVLCYTLSLLLIIVPNYILLENRVMYERIYKLGDHVNENEFDWIIIILLFVFLVILFLRRLKMLVLVLSMYVAILIILWLYSIPAHNFNLVLTPLVLLVWLIFEKSLLRASIFRSLVFFNATLIMIGCISIGYSIISVYGILNIQDRIINFTAIWYSIASQLTPFLFIFLFLLSIWLVLKIFSFRSVLRYQYKKNVVYISDHTNKASRLIALGIIVTCSILITLIPHLPSLNPEHRFVGYDTGYYITWLREFEKGENFFEIILIALQQSSGDRFLSLVIIFGIHWITNIEIESMIEYIPLILSPLLVLVTYLLTYEITKNYRISLLSSFLTPFSVQVSMGIYSGFYSNWIAIIIAYTSIIFYIKFCKFNNPVYAIIFSLGLTALCFTHIYTWFFFVICLGVSLLLIAKYQSANIKSSTIIVILIILISSSIGFIIPWLIFGNVTGYHNFNDLFSNDFDRFTWSFIDLFNFVILVSHGGLFSNVMIPILCIAFLISLHRQNNNIYLYIIVSILFLGTLSVFLGGIEFKTRILYNIPFQIPAAIGLFILYERTKSKYLLIGCCLLIVSYSLYALTNYYLVPAETMYPQDFSN